MIVPDWFARLLEFLGLKKSEKSVDDCLRDLRSKREEKFRELDDIAIKVKILEAQEAKMAKSDVVLLRKEYAMVEKSLAAINTHILQLMTMKNTDEIDTFVVGMQEKLFELNGSIVKLERAVGVTTQVNELVTQAEETTLADPTLTGETAGVERSVTENTEKKDNNMSENTNSGI